MRYVPPFQICPTPDVGLILCLLPNTGAGKVSFFGRFAQVRFYLHKSYVRMNANPHLEFITYGLVHYHAHLLNHF